MHAQGYTAAVLLVRALTFLQGPCQHGGGVGWKVVTGGRETMLTHEAK